MNTIPPDSALEERIFRRALLIRLVESRIQQIYPGDRIQSPVHLSLGQEHHVAALCEALAPDDALFSSYRCHAAYLAKGGSLPAFFAELFGKATGVCGGKAGSMHLCAPEQRMLGSSAIVGAIFSHAVGYAYGQRLKREAAVTVALAGDGATEEGTFFESLNMASLLRAPVLFLIENNELAIFSPRHQRQSYRLAEVAASMDIPYLQIDDGFDFLGVHRAARAMRETILARPGPAMLEIRTCRYCEHVGINPNSEPAWRAKAELWQRRDPLIVNAEALQRFSPLIEASIDEAVAFADRSPWPEAEALLKDVIE